MVSQIIPALPQSDQTELITETILSLKQGNHDIPSTMNPNNFQTEIGGHIQGLIGAKHLQEFPVPVMHLSNGLSIFKHTLRPAGDRNRVYCIGGTLPALSAFKEHYGPNIHQISTLMIQGELEYLQDPLYDGDVRDPSLRSFKGLLSNEQFRKEQSEEDCQRLDQASSQVVDSAPASMQDFCVSASAKMPP